MFEQIFNSLDTFELYSSKPPKGPPDDLPTISDEEMAAVKERVYGEKSDSNSYAYDYLEIVDDDYKPKEVPKLRKEDFQKEDIYAIDGSNVRIEHPSFIIILSRAALVRFTYSCNSLEPQEMFEVLKKDLNGLMLVDGNIFSDKIKLHTHIEKTNANLLPIINSGISCPILSSYDPDKEISLPSSQAIGIGVKYQQALELSLIQELNCKEHSILIKDGPLFSTSGTIADTIEGLNNIYSWKDNVLFGVSKRISESTLISQLLTQNKELRDKWFPKQTILQKTIQRIPTDQILLARILKPGERTPFVEAVARSRKKIVQQDQMLAPIVTFYLSRKRPHTLIRVEIPKYFWINHKDLLLEKLKYVIWQLEIGDNVPKVQSFADDLCKLDVEYDLTVRQLRARLFEKKLSFPEVYK